MADRTADLAQVFARLRWAVGGEFSVSLTPVQCGIVLEAMGKPDGLLVERAADALSWIENYPLNGGVNHGNEWVAVADSLREALAAFDV